MTNQNYTDITIQQSQKKFDLMKKKMLEPVKQVQQAWKEKNNYMNQQIIPTIKNSNSNLEGKAFSCSEIFTLDNQRKVIKKEWKCEEIKDWEW